tara:strand:- start:1045 stop:1374 length:330 start_codon:yes stop_codon:yes gene_type:complete
VVISPQLEKYSKQVAKKNKLTYPVLCDQGNNVGRSFGIAHTLPEDLAALYNKFGIDLVRFNGDERWELSMPARYIIDSGGTILEALVNPDYTQRPEPKDLPGLIKELTR